ncbi:CaiB/BaiF CoA transferase family protein [Chloroflexota bacterium]
MKMDGKALDGVNVLSFCWRLAGPMTNTILAAYGATVVKVETATRLDTQRDVSPFIGGEKSHDRATGFLFINSGKLGITLNLKHPKGMSVARRLIKWADVVIENFAGGAMERMGLGYEVLKGIKPDIIMLSSCLYGQTGPMATVPGYAEPLTAATGIPYLTGFPDQLPQFPGFGFTDPVAIRANALAVASALDYRERTGKGQYIDAAQLETTVPFLAPLLLDYQANNREAKRLGNRSDYAAPHGVYRCRGEDRWVAITVFSDQEWRDFCRAIGSPEWTRDPALDTASGRLENVDRLDDLVEGWTQGHTAREVTELLQGAGVAAGMASHAGDLDNDPQLKHRHFYWELEHPKIGAFSFSGMPVHMSKTPYEIKFAPGLGEHNEYVYTRLIGMSDEEFHQLLAEGTFE